MRLPLSLRVTRPQWLGGLGSIGPFRGREALPKSHVISLQVSVRINL